MKSSLRTMALAAAVGAVTAGTMGDGLAADTTKMRYGHMNAPGSVAGEQAQMFADLLAERTNGAMKMTVYPSSQLGKLQEQAEGVSMGSITMSHNTAAGIGSLYAPFAALDTPYLYRNVDHLMKVVDVDSPVMKALNEGLIKAAGTRVLYAFYFGTRQLTANKAFHSPESLAGTKIRAIPFPIYMSTVAGLGAIPVPVNFSELPTALATGVVSGQENPIETIYASKIYEVQSHIMLTGHIMGAEIVVINNKFWESLDAKSRDIMAAVANEVRVKATKMELQAEKEDLEIMKKAGVTVIGEAEGLKLAAFKASVRKVVQERLADKYGDLYKMIEAIK